MNKEQHQMDASHYGTLYQSLQKAVATYPDNPAYAVPPAAGRIAR